jgi:imidazolonepropionase-like amidohydrolase
LERKRIVACTLITDVDILDGTSPELYRGEVLVEGNRIRTIARGTAQIPRDGKQVIEGHGATLMPGMVECHAHLSFADHADSTILGAIPPEEHTALTLRHARIMLDQGFTSCISAASAKLRLDVVVRDAINSGDFPGPRLLAASPEMTVTGGLGDVRLRHLYRENFGAVCDGPESFRAMSRLCCREGVDILKINPSGDEMVPFARAHQTVMNDAEVAAVVEVGRSRDRRVAAHARSAESVKMCVRHGIRYIYHATLADEEALDMLEAHKRSVFVGPTIGSMYTTSFEASQWGVSPQLAEQRGVRRELEVGIENMKQLRKRGVRIVPGGDYGMVWNRIGTDARDVEHFVKLLGFAPMEAIQAITRVGGEMMAESVGQIREGYLADLLLVDGNPLDDVKILQNADHLVGIMKDGAFHKDPRANRPTQRQFAA